MKESLRLKYSFMIDHIQVWLNNADLIIKKIIASEDYSESKGDVITFVNPISFCTLIKQEASELDKLSAVYVDGFYAALMISLFTGKRVKRRSLDMTSLAKAKFKQHSSVGLIGAHQDELIKAVEVLSSISKGKIYAIAHGYLDFDDETILEEISDRIRACAPSYVFVGLGSGMQENISLRLASNSLQTVYYTCGGFITQTAQNGKSNYYPNLIDQYNLRWLYRLYKEPHTRKRFLKVAEFLCLLLLWKLNSKNRLEKHAD